MDCLKNPSLKNTDTAVMQLEAMKCWQLMEAGVERWRTPKEAAKLTF